MVENELRPEEVEPDCTPAAIVLCDPVLVLGLTDPAVVDPLVDRFELESIDPEKAPDADALPVPLALYEPAFEDWVLRPELVGADALIDPAVPDCRLPELEFAVEPDARDSESADVLLFS